MAACAFCKADTELYDGGVPVCVDCSDVREAKRKPPTAEHQIRTVLHQEFLVATDRAKQASAVFEEVMNEVPSGMPHPDGTHRIHRASREVSLSRIELMKAHNRLNDYLGRGIVPEDLKRRA